MELVQAIQQRKSTRHFLRHVGPTPAEMLKVLSAADYIPRAGGIRSLSYSLIPNTVDREVLSSQYPIHEAPVILVVSAINYKEEKYGTRGARYTVLEAGHAAQNICLMVTALGLGCVTVGAFKDRTVKRLLQLDGDPLYLIPIGYKSA